MFPKLEGRNLLLAVAWLIFVIGAWLGWSARGWGARRAATATIQQADATNAANTAALQEGVQHVQAAHGLDQAIEAAHAAVVAHAPRPWVGAHVQGSGPVRPADSVPADGGSAVAVADDHEALISDLRHENDLLHQWKAEAEPAMANLRQAAEGLQRENAGLRTALQATTLPEHPWAVGGIYGTSQTWGAFVERDMGPFRTGVDVVRRALPSGTATIDTTARLGWRFSWGK
jgi:hypothetical protein